MVLEDNTLVIIDWGMAITIGEKSKQREYSASMWFTADGLLDSLGDNWQGAVEYNAKTDLESVVKTIAYMTVPGARNLVEEKRAELAAVVAAVNEAVVNAEADKAEADRAFRMLKKKGTVDEDKLAGAEEEVKKATLAIDTAKNTRNALSGLTPKDVDEVWAKIWKRTEARCRISVEDR